MILKKIFLKLMTNAVFEKTMENVMKRRNNKLVTTEIKINYLVSEANYHIIEFFTENLFAIEMEKRRCL